MQIIVGGPPLVPTGVYAIASKDEIRLGYNPDSSKLDTRSYVTYEISKHGAPASTVFGDVSGTYQFDRTDDGYPEAEDLALWKVRARTHNGSGTASEWSEEVSVDVSQYGTWKPVAPTGVTALAEKEYIALAWKAGNKAENKDIYGTTIFRVKRNGETVATAYSGTSYTYYFDRTIGEYPEKSDFLTEEWKFTVEASNESGNAAESDAARYNSENYLTWLPAVPKLDASASKRTVGFSIHADNSYWGWLRYEVQISRNGEDWYSCGNSDDAYLDESAWQGEMDEDTDMYSSQHFQVVPLSGQAAGRPENTTYRFRVRAVTKTSKENKSEYSQSLIVLATASGVEDIVQSSITTEKLAPSAVTIDKLNVLATNLVNSLVREKPDERSVDGWTEGLTTAEDAETGFVVGLLAGKNEADSNPFQILADAVYEFKFGLEFSGAGESNGQSVGAGVKGGESYRRYRWDFVKKQWFYNDTGSDACFVSNFRSDGRKYFTTYIIGSNVDTGCVTSDGEGVSGIPARNIPAPSYTDESYQVFAVQLLPRCTETRLRISNDGSVPEHAALLLICPQVYQTGSGRIVAENVVAANLSAISANLGDVMAGSISSATKTDAATGNEMPDPDNSQVYINSKIGEEEFFVGNVKKSLAKETEPNHEYIWLRKVKDVFEFVIKITNLVITSMQTVIKGIFRVKASVGDSDADAFMTANPTNTADNGTPARTLSVKGNVLVRGPGRNDAAFIVQGVTENSNSCGDKNPKIVFKNTDGSQIIELIFTDFDAVQAPASITLRGNQGGEWFIIPNLKIESAIDITSAAASNSPTPIKAVGGKMASNDFWRIAAGGTSNNGFVEIATADDGTEPIYIRQYSGTFATLVRTLTLLDGSGNTSLPGNLTLAAGKKILTGRPSAGYWVKGRDNAVIRQAEANELWAPFISIKTKDGSIEIGTCNTDNTLYFRYASDANYNAGSNAVDLATASLNISGNAATATKAVQDGSGRTITSTYIDGTYVPQVSRLTVSASYGSWSSTTQSGYYYKQSRTCTLTITAVHDTYTKVSRNVIPMYLAQIKSSAFINQYGSITSAGTTNVYALNNATSHTVTVVAAGNKGFSSSNSSWTEASSTVSISVSATDSAGTAINSISTSQTVSLNRSYYYKPSSGE